MLFCAKLNVLLALLRKHRHFYPPRYYKLIEQLFICLILQRAIRREEKFYNEHVQSIAIQDHPVFITGHWRSGTTFLHYTMALDNENFAYSTSYQCIFPAIFLTVSEHSWFYKLLNMIIGKKPRVIDNMEFSLSLPQEDEWMYVPEGGFSYIFENIIFPKTALYDYDEIIKLSNDELTKQLTMKIFKKLTYAYQKRILSKSSGHFSRMRLLKEIFPRSKFIVLIRHPYEVVISTIHMKDVLRKMVSLQKYTKDDILSSARFLNFYQNTIKNYISTMCPEDYIFVKFEELVNHPVHQIQNIYRRFQLEYREEYEQSLIAYLDSIHEYKRNEYDISSDTKEIIYSECNQLFRDYDYHK